MELGILKTVPARQRWNNEARDFTPWLANNIGELNKAIGIELEVENIEVAAGPYSADILAKDTGTDKYVVIENQLEKTNHDHLGKAITYASVLDASTIIWIATDFTEEHKKALDWLNDHTSEEISIFGVQVELWQIDNSNPALKFNIISRPNQAVRQAARSKATEDLTESKKFQFDFWNKFKDKLAQTKKIPSLQTPRPQYWFDVSLGKAYIHISNTCNTDFNIVGIRVYIGNKIADTMLPYLESKKEEIEAAIGQPLQWNPNPENRDKTIALFHTTDFSNPNKVEEALNWLVSYNIKFREVFSKLVAKAPAT
ncbi:MAG: DUF4268 domain-containing protein [Lewinellaceae bacterium]|nr:DUF4268 domain-containing protein [Saprospiraceae bacterium]MCB9341254.1 DUF4268 domain-containing protein [Lewinellaceae bacterium]